MIVASPCSAVFSCSCTQDKPVGPVPQLYEYGKVAAKTAEGCPSPSESRPLRAAPATHGVWHPCYT
eukprot:6102949-Amphidinium_carterae.2